MFTSIKKLVYGVVRALGFCTQASVPSQHLVRAEVMDAFEHSVARNRDLLRRLAQ